MPRKGRRSQAQKQRWRKPDASEMPTPPVDAPHCSRSPQYKKVGSTLPAGRFWEERQARANLIARRGTGYRHKVLKWPTSPFTGRNHKLVIPPERPGKKFILIVGDSHLRALVDGFIQMPESRLSFGFLSIPGASASEIRTEVLHAAVPRAPDAVCVMAPGNNLTSTTVEKAGVDFANLLTTCGNRWSKVFVVGFPPRLVVDVQHQDLLRQEYRRVAARMGVKFFNTAEHFPLSDLVLWSKDGVHLSDREGMGILVQLFWSAASEQLMTPPPSPRISPQPPVRKATVRERSPAPPSPKPRERRNIGQGGKTSHPREPPRSRGSPKPRMAQQQVEESFLPLNPVWFSSTALSAMEKVSPSHMSCLADFNATEKVSPSRMSCLADFKASPKPKKLFDSPPARLTCSWGKTETPVCSPIAKMAKMMTPSPNRQAWTADDAGCKPPSPQKMTRTLTPSQTKWPWFMTAASTSADTPTDNDKTRSESHHVESVRASHSQNDKRYKVFSRNHQCSCNALTFLAYHTEGCQFTRTTLDRVLAQGDALYVGVKQQLIRDKTFQSNHLAVEEMPKQVLTDRHLYNVNMSEIRCGFLKTQVSSPGRRQWWLPLATQLECLSAEVNQALIIISPEVIAVFRDQSGRYGVFDSHSRDLTGLPSHSGKAIVMTFAELSDLANHLHTLFRDRGDSASYEFVPVSFQTDSPSEHPQQSPETEVQNEVSEPALLALQADSGTAVKIEEDVKGSSAVPQAINLSRLEKDRRRKAKRRAFDTKEQLKEKIRKKTGERIRYASCAEFRRKKIQAHSKCVQKNREQRLLSSKKYYAKFNIKMPGEQLKNKYMTDSAFRSRKKIMLSRGTARIQPFRTGRKNMLS
ncbi:uncharacterized protein LOC127531296 [Acanthochromis polyacanthus]|uniref:uncharacterized protein LOC127531296 n=1 Tax=Acanthochromis polyacanthus TaxID=80966 RepID=UPI002234A5DD|nr:uncharacterized protein LOC127531296 [Acanthochromis polyacanthus]